MIHDTMAWLRANEAELSARSLEVERRKANGRAGIHMRERFGRDPEWRRMVSFRNRFTSCLLRKWCGGREPQRDTQTAQKLFGCPWREMRNHIEGQFQPGMTWLNHGKGPDQWCLDHRRPVCLFNWWTWEGLKEAFHWSNVQPLWGWQHRAKNDQDNREARQRRQHDEELKKRLKPVYAPPLEGTDEEIMARLARELGV